MASKDAQPRQDKEAKLPRVVSGSRFVTQYDPAKAAEILERVADGETINKICRGVPGMPHPTTFKRWLVNHPDLARAYATAVQASAVSLEEEALDAARAIALLPKDGTHVRATEVKLGQLRWSAERRDPGKYGSKSQVSIRVPIQIITPLDLESGKTTGTSSNDIYTIEAKVIEETPPLVDEKPPRRGNDGNPGPRKKVLAPRNPFWKVGDKSAKKTASVVRKQGSEAGNGREPLRSGDEGVYQPRAQGSGDPKEIKQSGEAAAGHREDQ